MSTPLDDRPRGEATQAWKDTQTGKANEQERQDINAEKPAAPPTPSLEYPAPTLGMSTRATEDRELAATFAKVIEQQAEKFADREGPDLLPSKERDHDAEQGRLKEAFEKAGDGGMDK